MSALFALVAAAALAQPSPEDTAAPCLPPAQWQDGQGRPLSQNAALAEAARARIILLGEAHETPGIHRWQADTARQLAADGRPLVIAVEWLPRAAQAALDAFTSGASDEAKFLTESEWEIRWGYDFAAYRPVFELARSHALPVRAVNIDRSIVRATSKNGLDAGLDTARKAGTALGRPAAPSADYKARLEASFAEHGAGEASPPKPEALARFIAAQTIWDRAMAEGIAAILAETPEARVVALMGHGHVEAGHGVAHQLAALGHRDVFSAIPAIADPDQPGHCSPGTHPAHRLAGWREE
ncbi:MAG: ChaN family lipoprotein [Polymorphobacter sp.]|uniref:ChaN family lipoprotein n=1 Tax=Polymorphobacter sp. TaxID=1909290 RepID=UPI003A849389